MPSPFVKMWREDAARTHSRLGRRAVIDQISWLRVMAQNPKSPAEDRAATRLFR